MRLTPCEPEIPENVGFTKDNDLFGYQEYGDRLATLVRNIDEPLVIALDGPWGSGKTVFAKQWAELVRGKGGHVIQFDAFANDHYEDAFLALSSEIYAVAKDVLTEGNETLIGYLEAAKKAVTVLTPAAFRIAVPFVTGGILNQDDIQNFSQAFEESRNEKEKVMEEVISKAHEERAALDDFREILSDLAEALAEKPSEGTASEENEAPENGNPGNNKPFPLVFIIDELDRCRPPFALGVIEQIKHLFSVKGVCFVLVTHLPQLENVVEGAYGAVDAQTYLEKFYQLRAVLPRGHKDREGHPPSNRYVKHLWDTLEINPQKARGEDLVREEITALANMHDLSLRTIERVMTHVVLAFLAKGQENRLFLLPVVAGLCVMRQTKPEFYKKARTGELTWGEARGFLELQEEENQADKRAHARNCWAYCTGGPLSEEKRINFAQSLFSPSTLIDITAQDILPHLAGLIDSFAEPVNDSV